ncbi:hypothetical protein C8R44DRAFT_586766, partial [Mycena epipterygia]
YWDDMLADQEIVLIYGVYKVATDNEHQTSRISWWPKPHTFSSSGLNVGWWSPDCEFWFSHRLKDINAGKARLHTQAEWK